MSPRAMRAVIAGASSLLAKELLEELSNSPAAVWDLQLLDEDPELEGKLTSAGDEAMIIQPMSAEAIAGADLVFFADAELARQHGEAAVAGGAAVIDLTGAMEGKTGFLVRSPAVQGAPRPDLMTAGIVVPQPAAEMLAVVMERMGAHFGRVDVAATVLEPASQAGAAGVEELHQQTINLLSFQEMPREIFDAQIAFNLQAALGKDARVNLAETRAAIRRQVLALLGGTVEGALSLHLLQAPVFHGYALSALAVFSRAVSSADLLGALDGAGVSATAETVPANKAAMESSEILVSVDTEPEDDARFWLTMAGDNLRLSARTAVAAALEMAALRPGSRVQ